MTHENVELATRAIAAATRRPQPDFETINEVCHPQHVLVAGLNQALGEGASIGARGYNAWLDENRDILQWEFELESAVDLGSNLVLVAGTTRFRGVGSGIVQTTRGWGVMVIEDGLVVRTEMFIDSGEAIRAAERLHEGSEHSRSDG